MSAHRLLGLLLLVGLTAAPVAFAQPPAPDHPAPAALKTRADRGDVEAELDLAELYASGAGVPRDPHKAARLHRKAADQGSSRGQFLVAMDYENGEGVKPNKAEAIKWLRLAAGQGLPDAEFAIGECYSNGDGVQESPTEASRWFRRAAEHGFPDAQAELGRCYLDGIGVLRDIPEGVKWTREAAEQGSGIGQNILGLCYAKGRGVEKNALEAYKWFNLASAQNDSGSAETKMNLAMAERALTPAQIAEGQRLAREFVPRGPSSTNQAPLVVAPKTGTTTVTAPPKLATPTVAAQKTGFVNVKAADDSYEVFVNGAFVGNSPARVKLPEGNHVVEVKKSGYKDFRRQIQVSDGADLNLRAVLDKQ